jgi:hypothetical protein
MMNFCPVTIASDCPPGLLRRLVTSLGECAHNTLDRCNRLLACWIGIGNNPALDHVVVRVECERHDLKCHCNNLRRTTRQLRLQQDARQPKPTPHVIARLSLFCQVVSPDAKAHHQKAPLVRPEISSVTTGSIEEKRRRLVLATAAKRTKAR